MGLLDGKKGLIFGVANDHSIAWGIAQALHAEGAELGFSYAGQALERRVCALAESIGSDFVEPCDVGHDYEIKALFEKARQ
ncbi:MAG TPA: SDR family oxidoreductase, partial [Anaerolineae bacterium]